MRKIKIGLYGAYFFLFYEKSYQNIFFIKNKDIYLHHQTNLNSLRK